MQVGHRLRHGMHSPSFWSSAQGAGRRRNRTHEQRQVGRCHIAALAHYWCEVRMRRCYLISSRFLVTRGCDPQIVYMMSCG